MQWLQLDKHRHRITYKQPDMHLKLKYSVFAFECGFLFNFKSEEFSIYLFFLCFFDSPIVHTSNYRK